MSSAASVNVSKIRQDYEQHGQGHVLTFWDELNETQKQSLLSQLSGLDVPRINKIFSKATSSKTSVGNDVSPLPESAFDSTLTASKEKIAEWETKGLELIGQNKVGVILLAGGQGTRLGSSAPKGCYDILLPSHKSLFQLQGERILRLQKLAEKYSNGTAVVIPWYVMTSGPTRAPTEAFFKEHNFFGLDPKNVFFFEQGVLPAFTPEGKFFMEQKDSLALAPDGNGGIYAALRSQGVIEDLKKRNIPYVHAYCVDNCLVKVADPVFIGFSVSKKADCAAKVVPKRHAHEPVGVICLKNGKFAVVEYSEIDPKMAEQIHPTSQKLVYNAANIANHFYTTEFLDKIQEFEGELEYHIARKKIKHVDLKTKEYISPKDPNGIKLELFIFDVFPFTERMAVLEVGREDEFSPLKNAPGSKDGDSPDTSRADILKQHARFLKAAGAIVLAEEDSSKTPEGVPLIEISPLVSYAGEGLESLKGVTIKAPLLISKEDDLKNLVA